MFKKILSVTLGLMLAVAGAVPSFAYGNSATWQGNGASIQSGNLIPSDQQCGASGDAPQNYLYWVLTASRANNADIDFDRAG